MTAGAGGEIEVAGVGGQGCYPSWGVVGTRSVQGVSLSACSWMLYQ